MTSQSPKPFFVGYLPIPPGLRVFLAALSAGLIGAFAALAFGIGLAQDEPGNSAFKEDWGEQTLTGILRIKPYPVLHVTKGTKNLPPGRAVLLTGDAKEGIQDRVEDLDGKYVTIKGYAMKRGDLDAVQVESDEEKIKATTGGATTGRPQSKSLGRWRLKGEICDGKCLAGAMKPGRGISHRACANLCLIGGAPPVFVSTAPVNGAEFFLLADKSGGPLPKDHLKYVAVLIAVDGEIERRGALSVFKVDLKSVKVLK